MAWTEKKELTAGQIAQAQIAGVPADRANLGGEYPKAVYREGEGAILNGVPFKINGKLIDTATVDNEEEEAEAISQGWYLTPDLTAEQKRRDEIAEKDAEIEALRAQLGEKRGPGRPPRPREEDQAA